MDRNQQEEERYVPIGSEFDDDDSWRYPDTEFEVDFLKACKRKYFPNEVTAKRVRAIEKRMNTDPPKFPKGYIDTILAWALKKNTPRITRNYKAVITAIRNPDNLDRYFEKHPEEDRNYDTETTFDW